MPRATTVPTDPDGAPLKRLGGGRWQTRDERFTIEPQSGTWVVVDAEQTDDFGLALVRGPFPSLTAAKEAIAGARTSAPETSPLAERIERRSSAPRRAGTGRSATPRSAPASTASEPAAASRPAAPPAARSKTASGTTSTVAPNDAPREPAWLKDLAGAQRGRARRLIERLTDDGVADAEGLVRRDIIGDVPALAAHAIVRHLAELGADASPDDVAALLADGRDERLGVRWRLVDGEGRRILLDPSRRRPR